MSVKSRIAKYSAKFFHQFFKADKAYDNDENYHRFDGGENKWRRKIVKLTKRGHKTSKSKEFI